MSRTTRTLIGGALVLAVIAALALAVHNYRECRAMGFGRLYCASTHLVR